MNNLTMNEYLAKFKDAIYVGAICLALILPYIQKKLGIEDIRTNQTVLETQIKITQEKINSETESIKNINCANIILVRGLLRLQNESLNNNEIMFAKLDIDSTQVALARVRISDVKKEVLEDLVAYSKLNNCVFK